ncbi:hypothetical protein KW5_0120410 [Xanthomonas vasicola pv. vasculorum NCPPB 1326]|nr:hypothetical protein KW5_0120410 [Xanthomonas vasicola pv. vasculorum NCPPB 1326]
MANTLFGYALTMYMMLPITSGWPSWPRVASFFISTRQWRHGRRKRREKLSKLHASELVRCTTSS